MCLIRKIITTFLIMAPPFISDAQLYELDTLYVTNLTEKEHIDNNLEGIGEGPYVYGKLILCNNTDSIVSLKNTIEAYYCFDNNQYQSNVYWFNLKNINTPVLPGGLETIEFGISLDFENATLKKCHYLQDSMLVYDYNEMFRKTTDSIRICVIVNGKKVLIKPEYIIADNKYQPM